MHIKPKPIKTFTSNFYSSIQMIAVGGFITSHSLTNELGTAKKTGPVEIALAKPTEKLRADDEMRELSPTLARLQAAFKTS